MIGAFSLSLVLLGYIYIKDENLLIYATGTNEKAFLNSTWLMSPNEIRRANNAYLEKPEWELFFTEPDVVNPNRYSSFKQKDIELWGHSTEVEYSFFDKKLFQYYIGMKSYDADKDEKEVLAILNYRFGSQLKIEKKSKHLLKEYEWGYKNQSIRFWISKDSKDKNYHFGITVKYLPYYNEIKKISEAEKKNYF